MNISQLGIAASAAATPLAQSRGSEVDRIRQETVVHERAVESTAEAEAAEGIGTTNEEQAASDRDADGRRPWEIGPQEEQQDDQKSSSSRESLHRAKDPTGQAGSQLDLSG
jgi:hypothetical protein